MGRIGSRVVRILVIVLGVLALVGLGISMVGRSRLAAAKERFVAGVGPLELSAFQRPDPPEERNAAHWLRAGADALDLGESDMEAIRRFLAAPIGEVPTADLEAVSRMVDRNQAAIQLLEKATDLLASSFEIDYVQGVAAEIPDHLELFQAARLARADARLALLEGDTDRLTRSLQIVDRTATAMTEEAALVTVLIGMSVDRDFLLLAHDIATAGLRNQAVLEDLARRLGSRDRTTALRRSFAAEGALVVATPMLEYLGGELCVGSRLDLILFESFQQAALLDGWTDLAAALDRPWVEIQSDFVPPPEAEPVPPWDVNWFMLPNILSSVEKLKANSSSAILAREAVETWRTFLSDSVFPAQASFGADDPYTGEPFHFETNPDGSVTLEAPGAADLWREENPNVGEDQRPVFSWTVRPTGS